MKTSSLQNRESKFTPKKFYEIDPWSHDCQLLSALLACMVTFLESFSPNTQNSKIFVNNHRGSVIKLFTKVIYHHSMLILSFCVIKLYYFENYRGMAVNTAVFKPYNRKG